MSQLQAIKSCSSPRISFHDKKRQGASFFRSNVCCVKKPFSHVEAGASSSAINGTQVVNQTCRQRQFAHNPAIQSVLSSEKDVSSGKTDVSGSHNESGLRGKLNKVVLAYSGGLDTFVIVPWLRENHGCEVVCFTADVGQGVMELEGFERKATASGACHLVVKDLKEEFVKDYIFPCLRAGATYERKYLLGTSMARPVIAKAMVDVAKEVGAYAVSHGCTGKGNGSF